MDILNMNIKSSFKYWVLFFLSAGIHITFLILFLVNGIYALAAFNVFSIAFYLIGGITVAVKNNFEQHKYAWTVLIYGEITLHAVLATLWLGFDSCFFIYSMVALTVASYVVYLSCSKPLFFKIIIPFAAVTFASLALCYVYLIINPPIITAFFLKTLDEGKIQVMRGINIFVNTFIVFFYSIVFIAEMHTLMGRLEETNKRLDYIANHDALTDMYNRHSLNSIFKRFVQNNKEAACHSLDNDLDNNADDFDKAFEESAFCVIMSDIDDFKKINDTYGHTMGDKVLKTVAEKIKESTSKYDIGCRWGGEEFLLIIGGDKAHCKSTAELIRRNVERIRFEEEPDLIVTMTFGLVFCKESKNSSIQSKNATKIDELVQIADSRLYAGKAGGKNVVVTE